MIKIIRIIDQPWSKIKNLKPNELIKGIKLSEGRTIAAEVVVTAPTLIDRVSNVEIAAAFGADIIILNFYDVFQKHIEGLANNIDSIKKLRDFLGRIIGVNLEPVKPDIAKELNYTEGRLATVDSAKFAVEDGADILVITANPMTGVEIGDIIEATRTIRNEVGNKVIILAGKMHLAGKYGEVISHESIKRLADAGANGILYPAPGTVPGIDLDNAKKIVEFAHENGLIVMSAIGTSQEGADIDTIRRIAFFGKMTGADIHHIGDSGYRSSVAQPENILAYSVVIKGVRHTYRRMSQSILR
ncbi:MAG: haloacid dehalogenase-like hydrolase [Candidatus Njordarchaeia archaeon]